MLSKVQFKMNNVSFIGKQNLLIFNNNNTDTTENSEKKDKIYEKDKELLDTKIGENKKVKEILKDVIINRRMKVVFCVFCGGLLKQTNKQTSNCFIDSKCTKSSYYYCYTCLIYYCTYCIRVSRAGKCCKGHFLFKIRNLYNESCKNCSSIIQMEAYNCNLCNITICLNCYNLCNSFVDFDCDKCKINLRWGKSGFEVCSNCTNFTICHWSCFFCKYYYCSNCIKPNNNYCGGFHYLESYLLNAEGSLTDNIKNIEDENSLANINPFVYICSKCQRVFSYQYKCCKRCNYQLCSDCSL